MILSIKVMRVIQLLSVLAVLLPTALGGGDCERGHTWWHRQRGLCLPCTHCDPRRLAVRYPCEPHRDTICQPLYEVRIWPFNTDNDTDYDYYTDYTDYSDVSDDTSWDIQTSTLTLAVTGCVVFFVVVLTLSLYHARQWRVLKHALKSDVQDLSAKLKLMEAGGETPEPVSDGHIYCNIHVGKNALLGSAATKKGLGNVYTQEKHIP